jgi:hypothetical protein
MDSRFVPSVYAYLVCLGCLALFAYVLLTLAPSDSQLRTSLRPIDVSVIDTDTTASGVDLTVVAAFDCTAAPARFGSEIRGLRASRKSFEDERAALEAERTALLQGSIRMRLMQRGLIALFALVVFAFHWRWLQRLKVLAA